MEKEYFSFLKMALFAICFLFVTINNTHAQHEVTGTVFDIDENSLPGVNIRVKGTTIGTTTDNLGAYSLTVPSPSDTLIFSYIGYQTMDVPIIGRNEIHVIMEYADLTMDDVVVVGYGTQSRRNISGSILSVSSEKLNVVAQSSINQMLQGKAPGLNLQTRSAQPGGGVSVNIRGAISPGGSNQPLYVIDGVPLTDNWSTVPALQDSDQSGGVLGFFGGIDRDPLSYLNPSDIESITVIKDASAAAIYGSAAANGVVLITTKSGRSGAIQVDYRGSVTTQTVRDYFPLLNAQQFMAEQDRLAREFHLYENNLAPYGSADPSNVVPYVPLFSEEEMNSSAPGTNWIDQITRNGFIQEHNIGIGGGNDQTKIYTSFSFLDNQAVLRNSTFKRYTGRLNIDQRLSRSATLTIRSTASRVDGNNATTGGSIGGAELYNMIQAATTYSPTLEVFDENGEYSRTFNTLIMNPVSFLDIIDDSKTTNVFIAPKLEIQFNQEISGTIRTQYDSEQTTRGFYLPRTSRHTNLDEGMAQRSEITRDNYSVEGFLTYSRSFNNGVLNAVAGSGLYRAASEGFGLVAIGFFTDAFGYNNVGVADDIERNQLSSWKSERTKVSQFARVNFTYLDKYIFSAVARRDGSSVFSENNKYAIFPGISAAWHIADENFMSNFKWMNELKFRAGYGLAGNESVLSGNTLQLYSPGFTFLIGNTLRNGVTLTQIANPDLTWETIHTLNLGLDFGIYQNRIRGAIDVYQKTAVDLLAFTPLPFNNAVGQIADNVGSTRSRGIELSLSTINYTSNTILWTSDFNVSYYKSYWLERNPRVALPSYVGTRDPFGAIYGWRTAGIIKSDEDRPDYMPNANLGNLIYIDQNNDGILDRDDVVIIGNSIPKWSVGFGNELAYRNFSFSFFLYGNLDFKRYNNFAPNVFGLRLQGTPLNTTTLAQDVWSSTNPNGNRPGVAPNPYDGNNPAGTDYDLQDASFIRIGDISFAYTIPERWILRSGSLISSAKLFVIVKDIAMFTNYTGFDPEYTETNPYPKTYSMTMGVEIRF
jgi:TonB-linked SusC/RagA family outer membrane protein